MQRLEDISSLPYYSRDMALLGHEGNVRARGSLEAQTRACQSILLYYVHSMNAPRVVPKTTFMLIALGSHTAQP